MPHIDLFTTRCRVHGRYNQPRVCKALDQTFRLRGIIRCWNQFVQPYSLTGIATVLDLQGFFVYAG